jgi:hypothetical protein
MKKTGLLVACSLIALIPIFSHAQELKSPEEFFGFPMGSEGNLARWDKIVEYFYLLDQASDRIVVRELGKSTEGHPFILAIISSEENLAAMDRYKEINRRLADPRGLGKEEIGRLIREGKYTLAVTNGLHATEVGGVQMSPELAYELITDESQLHQTIRENCFLLLFPSFNPDGQILVTDWYNKYKGTEYEGARLPFLYHKYTGHDNNRDGYALTQAESRMVSRVLYQEWCPQAFIDHHHMGGYGARLYIPPYFDPIHPGVDPLVWREHLLYGALMAMRLEEAEKSGIETGAPYTAWWMPSFHMITNYHNISGMLTESASADLATSKYIHAHQLQPGRRGRPEYKAQVHFPNPWPGGWWRLRDIVEQIKISTLSALELGARNKEMLLNTNVQKALRSIRKGENEPPFAYLVPESQHDQLTALKMIEKLMLAGVEVNRADEDFYIGNAFYPAGTYVIKLNQPLRTYVKCLLERTFYPQNDWTYARDGSPIRPYDMAAFTMAEHMGVATVELHEPLPEWLSLGKVEALEYPTGGLMGDEAKRYLLDPQLNDAFIAINRILKAGGKAWRVTEPVRIRGIIDPVTGSILKFNYPAGAILLEADRELLQKTAEELHLTLISPNTAFERAALEPPRLGLYQRYQGGNMDEGWTRFVLEQFEFDYMSVMSDEIKEGKLIDKFDVIILPDDSLEALMGPDYEKPEPGEALVPQEYRTGLGEEGVKALKEFVEAGGTLITLDSACGLPLEKFDLPVRNVVDGLPSTEFFCPGSTLWMQFDTAHPLAYGMPAEALGIFWSSPAFAVEPSLHNEDYRVVASYPQEGEVLRSGWLIGEKRLYGKASLIDAKMGKGRVILFGFRPQLRAQTHGTFRLLFNAVYYSVTERKLNFTK